MIVVYNELHVDEFKNFNSGEPSNWKLRVAKGEGGFCRLQLHWGDKTDPTHSVTVPLSHLIKGLEVLL